VLVVGLARSGIAACNVLLEAGSRLKATDTGREADLPPSARDLAARGVEIETGGNTIGFAGDCDVLVLSPGVPTDIDLVRWAYARGKTVMSEVELAYCLSDARFVAVTGTNGKTTTVSLLGEILKHAGHKVRVGGNIGDPVSTLAAGLDAEWVLVLEVSSFQLDTCITFRPEVAVLLNITPDHLDRYDSFEAYARSKGRLFVRQTPDDTGIINYDDTECIKASREAVCSKLYYSITGEPDQGAFIKDERVVVRVAGQEREIFLPSDLRIRGPHNLANSLAASLAATALGCPPKAIRAAIREFGGLEHRLEPVGSIGAVEFINDSKATNVDSMRSALGSIRPPVVLIAGGRNKGGDFTPLVPLVRANVKTVVAIGESREELRHAFSPATEVLFADDMDDAVRAAYHAAAPSGTVLLSPGCASFDMFDDFEHRGRVFKQSLETLKAACGGRSDG
jgi:UDP-N-acetylmuramoylalanine--D-glutamate ligase